MKNTLFFNKIVFIICFICISNFGNGQSTKELFTQPGYYQYVTFCDDVGESIDQIVFYLNDTIINNQTYHRYHQFNTTGKFLRIDQRQVYLADPEFEEDFLLYDFDGKVGDTLSIYRNHYTPPVPHVVLGNYEVTESDTIFNTGIPTPYRFMPLINLEQNKLVYWFEGVGNLEFGIFQESFDLLHTCQLNCVGVDSTIWTPGWNSGWALTFEFCENSLSLIDSLYNTVVTSTIDLGLMEKQSEIVLFPNPVDDEFKIETSISNKTRIRITDSFGNVYLNTEFLNNIIVTSKTWPTGLYFVSILDKQNRIYTKKLIKI